MKLFKINILSFFITLMNMCIVFYPPGFVFSDIKYFSGCIEDNIDNDCPFQTPWFTKKQILQIELSNSEKSELFCQYALNATLFGDYVLAVEYYTKAIILNREASIYNSRGLAYGKQGEYELAIDDYNMAIELEVDNAKFYNNRGVSYSKLGKYELAIYDFNQAIELASDDAIFYFNRSYAYFFNGEYEKADIDYNYAIELLPNSLPGYFAQDSLF